MKTILILVVCCAFAMTAAAQDSLQTISIKIEACGSCALDVQGRFTYDSTWSEFTSSYESLCASVDTVLNYAKLSDLQHLVQLQVDTETKTFRNLHVMRQAYSLIPIASSSDGITALNKVEAYFDPLPYSEINGHLVCKGAFQTRTSFSSQVMNISYYHRYVQGSCQSTSTPLDSVLIDIAPASKLTVIPNSTSSRITFDGSMLNCDFETVPREIQVFDNIGRLRAAIEIRTSDHIVQFPLRLSQGFYFIRCGSILQRIFAP